MAGLYEHAMYNGGGQHHHSLPPEFHQRMQSTFGFGPGGGAPSAVTAGLDSAAQAAAAAQYMGYPDLMYKGMVPSNTMILRLKL